VSLSLSSPAQTPNKPASPLRSAQRARQHKHPTSLLRLCARRGALGEDGTETSAHLVEEALDDGVQLRVELLALRRLLVQQALVARPRHTQRAELGLEPTNHQHSG